MMPTITSTRSRRGLVNELICFLHSTQENLLEWVATFCLAACSVIVTRLVQPRERVPFFENFNERYPYSGETIGAPIVGILIILLPALAIALTALVLPRRIDLSLAGMGFAQTLCLNLLITELLKVTVARPRPNFFSYCGFDTSLGKCVGPLSYRRDARLSFPSGHASSSFASGTWMFLFIGSFQKGSALWTILIKFIPLGMATFIAATRITDYMHHVSDVIAGSVLGISLGAIVFASQHQRVFMVTKKKLVDDDLDPFSGLEL
jgi:membrane-associated phospholipid phosphatase